MKPYYEDDLVAVHLGDALSILRELPTASVDALVTDPPYSSGGMVRGDRAGSDVKAKYSGSYGKQPEHTAFTGGQPRSARVRLLAGLVALGMPTHRETRRNCPPIHRLAAASNDH